MFAHSPAPCYRVRAAEASSSVFQPRPPVTTTPAGSTEHEIDISNFKWRSGAERGGEAKVEVERRSTAPRGAFELEGSGAVSWESPALDKCIRPGAHPEERGEEQEKEENGGCDSFSLYFTIDDAGLPTTFGLDFTTLYRIT